MGSEDGFALGNEAVEQWSNEAPPLQRRSRFHCSLLIAQCSRHSRLDKVPTAVQSGAEERSAEQLEESVGEEEAGDSEAELQVDVDHATQPGEELLVAFDGFG